MEKWGAQYLNAKLLAEVAVPVAYPAITQHSLPAVTARVKSLPYWEGVAVGVADRWGSKKIGQAAALSRNSVTALVGEAYPVVDALVNGGSSLAYKVNRYNLDQSGYDFVNNQFSTGQVTKYGLLKYGLGVGRKLANQSGLLDPLKKGLSMVGASL